MVFVDKLIGRSLLKGGAKKFIRGKLLHTSKGIGENDERQLYGLG